ncbi:MULTISPECIES: DUF6705 family protein [unclassified Chryseobacterium]|uniref:DUF6705 family protein n=1 Tax=unclassified Chryseobacterium TaxID=2593645 RepID=UPI002269D715|nr:MULTISPECIES: DUF6705 family protein [unclassified Chryseobacterium]
MKKIIYIIAIIISVFYKAQQVYPLNTDFDNVPPNSYLKDINNELNPFSGTYKANYQGKEITLFITMETMKFLQSLNVYQDILSVKYIIKNQNGVVLQDTQNMNFQLNQLKHTIFSHGTYPNKNVAWFNYGGTNCGVGWGAIELKKLNATQISWEYRPNDIILDSARCPQGADINIYLPETKDLIFTKQ